MGYTHKIRACFHGLSPTRKPREWFALNVFVLASSFTMMGIACFATNDSIWLAELKQDYLLYNCIVTLVWSLETALEAFPPEEDGGATTDTSNAAAEDVVKNDLYEKRGIATMTSLPFLHFLVAAIFLSDAFVALWIFKWDDISVGAIVGDILINTIAYIVVVKYTYDRLPSNIDALQIGDFAATSSTALV